MDINTILSHVDHTLLSPEATWKEISDLCDDGIKFKTASVCIPPSFVKKAAEYIDGRLPICTVIGFPNGYSTVASKCFEASDAVENGAQEVDLVINIGFLKDGLYDRSLDEIRRIRRACDNVLLKVIVETCLLTEREKIEICKIVSDSGADYIKTSTGFSKCGATFEDVALMKRYCAPHLKIKAAGGITTLDDAQKFLQLGASRLGTSRIVKLAKQQLLS